MINACLAGFFCMLINLQPFHASKSSIKLLGISVDGCDVACPSNGWLSLGTRNFEVYLCLFLHEDTAAACHRGLRNWPEEAGQLLSSSIPDWNYIWSNFRELKSTPNVKS